MMLASEWFMPFKIAPQTNVLEALLETDRLTLEPLLPDHASILLADLQDHRLYQYIPQDPPKNLQVLSDRFKTLRKRFSPKGDQVWLNWAVRLKANAQYVGLLQATVNQDHSSSIAYFIFSAWQQRGYCKESLRHVISFLFEHLEVTSVLAEIDTRNCLSINVVQGLGFKKVGLKADADFFKGGSSSEYRYCLKRNRWNSLCQID